MKKAFVLVMLVVLFGSGLTSCSSVSVGGDEEAVLLKQPWFVGSGGVDDTPVQPGQQWVAFTTETVKFKTSPVTYKESFDDLISDDNIPVDFDIYVELQVIKGKTPNLYKNFGEKWYDNKAGPTIRGLTRDEASKYKMFDLAGNREVLGGIERYVQTELAKHFEESNVDVIVNKVTMGKVTPPPQVLEETQRTAAQNQSILTQNARASAETARKQAEINKAIADNAYRGQMNMTMDQYLHLRALEIEKEKVELIRGKENISVVFSGGAPIVYPVK